MTTINIPDTALVITIERVLDESNQPTSQMLCLVRDKSIAAPEFNPITFLNDAWYNVVSQQFFTA
jgi:hypothetical protein